MIKNVIFDLGGVLLDWHPNNIKNTYEGDKRLSNLLGDSHFFDNEWAKFDKGIISQEDMALRISEYTGVSLSESSEFMIFVRNSLVNIPKTENLIKHLYNLGYPLYCLTNMSIPFFEYLDKRDIFNLFRGKVVSAIENEIKPDEEIYNIIINRYNLIPDETLFIDDLKANILTANNLGLHTVHFSNRENGYNEIFNKLNLPPHPLD